MKPEIIPCSIPGCTSTLTCAPDRGPNPKTWVCYGCELDAIEQYFNQREAELNAQTIDRILYQSTDTHSHSGDF